MNINKLSDFVPQNVLNQVPDIITKFNINNPLRLAHFLSQCAHESGEFKHVEENLNYRMDPLLSVFKHDFDINRDRVISESEKAKATQLVGHPDKIANFIYANQNGNGSESSGDGYKFRGRGYIQLTGKSNYTAFDKFVDDDIISNPDLVSSKYPLLSAAWFFFTNNLHKIADEGNSEIVVTKITKKINGGIIGLPERIKHFNTYYNELKKGDV